MSSFSRDALEKWIGAMNVRCDRVLDIGGSQLPVKSRVQSFNVKEYLILDTEVPHECKQKPDIIFDMNSKMYYNSFPGNSYYEYFDRVFMLEVSEYLFNPIRAFKNVGLFLKPGGILYISTHFVYPVHNPVQEDYVRYTPRGIEKMLEITGFEIISNTPRLEKTPEFLEADGFGETIMHWFIKQRMRPAKEYSNHNVVGSLIKAKKKIIE